MFAEKLATPDTMIFPTYLHWGIHTGYSLGTLAGALDI